MPTDMSPENKKPFAKALAGRVSAALLGAVIGFGVGSQIPTETSNHPPEETPSAAAASPTPIPTETVRPTPTATETPTPTPTPEAPKFVYWTREQIETAQKEALKNGQILILDTWSEKGGKAENVRNGTIGIKEMKKDQTFDLPIGGKVESVVVGVGSGFKDRTVYIKLDNGVSMVYFFSINDEILIKEGQSLTVSTPISKLSGENFPRSFPAGGYIIDFGTAFPPDVTTSNVLRDNNGLVVRLQSQNN